MRALLLICLFIGYGQLLHAQAGISLDVNEPANSNGYGLVRFSNVGAQNSKTGDDIDLGDVAGSPYFNNTWNRAVVVLTDEKPVKLMQVKLNLCNNELHYIDSAGREMVLDDANVKRVFLLDNKDTFKVYALFQVIQNFGGKAGGTYMQALNQGKTQLLKQNEIKVVKRDYDVMAGKYSYSFQSNTSYFFLKNGSLVPCRHLNKAEVFSALLPGADASTWLFTNKNKLKDEKDIVSFLAYYDTLK